MRPHVTRSLLVVALGAVLARAEGPPARPDPAAAPVAKCKLQALPGQSSAESMPAPVGLYAMQAPSPDALANYERTPLGNWPMPAQAGRDDPWLRLVLLARDRPVLIDLAVFIDGKPFRQVREAWIDDVLAGVSPAERGGDTGAAANKKAAESGTNTAVVPSKDESPSEAPPATTADTKAVEESDATDEVESQPGVAAQAREVPTMRARLMNYLDAAGSTVDREEVGWLIAEWGSGPAMVVLSASQSWQRASLAPLLAYLDQDMDGALSAAEIGAAEDRLKGADVDGNDVVDVSEIRRQIRQPAAVKTGNGHPLLVVADANTDWDSLASDLARLYATHAPADAAQSAQKLLEEPANAALRVDFATGDEGVQALAMLSVSPQLAVNDEAVLATSDAIALDIGGDYVEFSAARGEVTADAAAQLAVGAVIDGNPLLRLVDSDQDGRLTLRERRALAGALSALDRDGDGRLAAHEVPHAIRLAVTLGPQVHELLSKPSGGARVLAPRATPQAPEWFASMDKNKDGDLSRGEFLGTTEQFRQFDENGDELLSIAEAMKLNPAQ